MCTNPAKVGFLAMSVLALGCEHAASNIASLPSNAMCAGLTHLLDQGRKHRPGHHSAWHSLPPWHDSSVHTLCSNAIALIDISPVYHVYAACKCRQKKPPDKCHVGHPGCIAHCPAQLFACSTAFVVQQNSL